MDGVINVLKPPGMTSSDVVVYLRRQLKIKKVGHTGTLDPGAAGVLIICLGKATKISDYIMNFHKVYKGGMILGTETDTLDSYGRPISQSTKRPSLEEILEVFKKYQGRLYQDPPIFSAIKKGGKPLYYFARQGLEVKTEAREIEIFENKIYKYLPPDEILFQVSCSKGTYIRSLVRDIGRDLGCGAYLSHLIRVGNGDFSIRDSVSLDEIDSAIEKEDKMSFIIPMDKALPNFRQVILDEKVFSKVMNGNKIQDKYVKSNLDGISKEELLRVYCKDHFMGLGYINSDRMIQMRKVLG